jgi:hypothetical protein
MRGNDTLRTRGQVAVNTVITDVNAFLDHIVAATNMRCLTPPSALTGACGFLAANLYAKSVFGEDALVNVSIEQGADGRLAGFIRIRRAAPLGLPRLGRGSAVVRGVLHAGGHAYQAIGKCTARPWPGHVQPGALH